MPVESIRSLALAGVMALAMATGAHAQGSQARDPNMPDPKTTVPEKVDPPLRQGDQDTTGTVRGGTLSEQLNRSDGVIRPPAGIDPEITAPAPVPNPGTMPVIPPPGTPGGNQSIDPK